MVELALPTIDSLRGPSTADLVFDALYRRVVELDLPPGAKISELEVARRMGVSRQPVRDAFYRLSQVGLLQIQPQRGTMISPISEEAVHRARFTRTALEVETVRAAAEAIDAEALAAIDANLAAQRAAIAADDRPGFQELDDAFHRAICAAAGAEFAWGLIRVNKAHMDRVRFLSLGFNAERAYEGHVRILAALRDADAEAAAAAMRAHLSEIAANMPRIRAAHPTIFAGPTGP